MTATRWNFPSGSNGDTLTNTLCGSTTISLAGGTGVLSNAQTLIGPLSARMVGVGTGLQNWSMEGLTATAYAADCYMYIVNHGSGGYVIWAGSSSSTRSVGAQFSAARQLRLINNAGTQLWQSSVLPLNTWVRISLYATCHATTGTACLEWYLGHDAVAQETSGTITGQNTLASIDRIRVGLKAASTAGTGEGYFSSWAYDPAATGLIAPYAPPPGPDPESVYVGDSAVDAIYVGDNPIDFAYLG